MWRKTSLSLPRNVTGRGLRESCKPSVCQRLLPSVVVACERQVHARRIVRLAASHLLDVCEKLSLSYLKCIRLMLMTAVTFNGCKRRARAWPATTSADHGRRAAWGGWGGDRSFPRGATCMPLLSYVMSVRSACHDALRN